MTVINTMQTANMSVWAAVYSCDCLCRNICT